MHLQLACAKHFPEKVKLSTQPYAHGDIRRTRYWEDTGRSRMWRCYRRRLPDSSIANQPQPPSALPEDHPHPIYRMVFLLWHAEFI